jgi:predicted S18 family serine protease
MGINQEIYPEEYKRITNDLHQNIQTLLVEVKESVANIEEEVKQIEAIDLIQKMEVMIEKAYEKILSLKQSE